MADQERSWFDYAKIGAGTPGVDDFHFPHEEREDGQDG